MKSPSPGLVTRRLAIVGGLASAGGLVLARWPKELELAPTYGNLLRMGDNLTYVAHRTLLPRRSLVREYSPTDVTSFPATGTTDPAASERTGGDAYGRLQRDAFADWRLSVEGSVAAPRAFSLAELKRLPSRTQVTRHTCEEGWTAIGQWVGAPLRTVLEAAGILATARYVVFHSFDGWVDGIDMFDALHPQTILAYGMNGLDLPVQHGAPLRVRVERQMGYKSVKYLKRIVVVDDFATGNQTGAIEAGWAWYTGI
jgi:DMSO/TMAO reductase YedYZ molybdopterin-dependent catalytic subunit